MQIYRSINIDIPNGLLEDVTACFEITVEEEMLEPYSWGQGRGYVDVAYAELTEVHLGGLVLNRDQMVKMLCEPEIVAYEDDAAEWAQTHLDELEE